MSKSHASNNERELSDTTIIRRVEAAVRASRSASSPCCEDVVSHLFELIDDELGEDLAASLRAHARACPTCSAAADAERHIRAIIRRSCAESAPASLREKVVSQLQVLRTELGESTITRTEYHSMRISSRPPQREPGADES